MILVHPCTSNYLSYLLAPLNRNTVFNAWIKLNNKIQGKLDNVITNSARYCFKSSEYAHSTTFNLDIPQVYNFCQEFFLKETKQLMIFSSGFCSHQGEKDIYKDFNCPLTELFTWRITSQRNVSGWTLQTLVCLIYFLEKKLHQLLLS